MKYLLLIILWLSCFLTADAQSDFCSIRNFSFQAGESITFKVYYNLGKMYVGAGEAVFNVSLEKYAGRDVYHIVGDGKTFRAYDWIFKVRDRYESYVDTATLQPLKFIRNVNEGGYKIYNNVVFNQAGHQAVSTNGTFPVPPCVQDVISAIYYARNIDFSKYNAGDKIPFAMFLDDQVYNIYIRYLGTEEVNTKFGKFRAIKFKPLLIKGTIFEGGEKMTVWVSDDNNKVPLRVESPISVGNIVVDMVNYSNLRYPFSSLLNKK
ncbi:Protein of unknown function [Chitinophaga terrae (ex Kim and Jung 2007)]|uniref:DUF3108 domain-containing protein n=1 Tax=Chitinophaga terrae (ex Kim and Jung 2007) TaxID=408074 RepID=A0A1H3Y763_9BACT|nr:DUF3108 domain-containing protein [Chitinophaga terrae (ex Kim and Jung 2007)]MDQ0108001.1 hypothetical protein [Chitinophaga terrae (ex Kim and Jung 2007)]GEP90930.1 hypothetical protein CTE07_25750 [Chitinophaga terrae (ex Kim and Jung 2007)]SEA06724.1 Protein of unknown function [Chitinophaga terrae (ex Kim and Jung 2007)]